MRSIKVFLKDPREITQAIVRKFLSKFIKDDRRYLGILYLATFWRPMNWNKPKTFNEKMTWLKVHDRNGKYSIMADKYAVKDYVSKIIGPQYVVENYAVARCWEEINFDSLPNQFVIKCTHDSGGAFICRDKKFFNYERVKNIIVKNLASKDYIETREWPYKNIEPRIIVDKFLDDETGHELRDYKFWCFNGIPIYMYCTIKAKNIYENFYDMDFKPVYIDHGFPRHTPEFEKPRTFNEMKILAKKLSKDIPFVRVDFFEVGGNLYFGEYTFYDWGAHRPFKKGWDAVLGKLLSLPKRD